MVQSETKGLYDQHIDGEVTTASSQVKTEQSQYTDTFSQTINKWR